MTRTPISRRAIGALAIFAMVSFHAVSAWAAACASCADMPCCASASDDTPPTDELNQASCCEVAPIEAMRARSELTPATLDSLSVDMVAAAPAVDSTAVQAPLTRIDQPRISPRALAPPPTRTIVLLL